jgi:quinol monooxygenase YgiN
MKNNDQMSTLLLVRINAKPEMETDIKDGFLSLKSQSSSDEGHGGYEGFYCHDDPSELLIYGIWQDEQALSQHQHTPHFKSFVGHFEKPDVSESFEIMIGNPRQVGRMPATRIFVGLLKVKARMEDAARQSLVDVVSQTRAQEPGCLHYDLYQNFIDPSCYSIYTVMKNRNAIIAHREASYFRTFMQEIDLFFEMQQWWVVERIKKPREHKEDAYDTVNQSLI